MKPLFTTVKGIKQAYYVKNDDKPATIFFVHGNSASALTWEKQFNDPRFDAYRLVALDLPAHGLSGPSDQPDQVYNAIGLGNHMAAFVQQLAGEKPYILVSISLGTNFVAESLAYGLLPNGLVFIGSCLISPDIPVSAILQAGNHSHVIFMDEPDEEDVIQYIREMHHNGQPEDLENYRHSYYQVRPPFRSALGRSVAAQLYSDEIGLINRSAIPVLLCMGQEERIIHIHYLDNKLSHLWGNQIFLLPGAGHLANADQPIALNEMLRQFVSEILDTENL